MYDVIVTRAVHCEEPCKHTISVDSTDQALEVVSSMLNEPGDHAVVIEYPPRLWHEPVVGPRAWAAFHRHQNGRIYYAKAR